MDSRQLRYFIAVYEQRNLSRAADQVNVAQSALSHHISNLEAEFATPLFERKSRGMEPTAAGERLYLVSRGRCLSIGSFLGPDEKASFAKALLGALQAAKRGISYNPVV